MLRDELKDKEYFDKYITDELNRVARYRMKIENGEHKNPLRGKSKIFGRNLGITESLYSRGDCIENIKKQFLVTVTAMEDYWTEIRLEDTSYSLDGTNTLLIVTSLAILLDCDKEVMQRIAIQRDAIPQKNKLVDYFITSILKDNRELVDEIDFTTYKGLSDLIEVDKEEILSKKLMQKYLKSWYKNHKKCGWYDLHKNPHDLYTGYWSFESAAFAKLKGLDDSTFKDTSPYYPKDLYTYEKN